MITIASCLVDAVRAARNHTISEYLHLEAYAKLSLKKYRPMAARNEDKKVFSGLL